ncbi:MAG TPA: D-glycero-beta-D-manno-heptose 1-phosphate adenylyltransferase [Candidatus Marinimicrobia bacterium]|nr:D-glycero-beta-D-manno-heptose 1-phosphate adenylyltransferase [Candidatus Neomarinimicrobiota bacterium]
MRIDRKIITRDQAETIIGELKSQNKRVVFTNGCFDLLHVGHLELLEQSKSFGDILVVGINTDRSLKIFKGPDRPILPQEERARLVASLEMVDYVVFFDEETPFEILSQIKPNILVKGGDYKFDEIIGRDIVDEVKIIPFVKGKSSTSIIDKILGWQQQTP